MGRFNIDDILNQLAKPHPNAPVERSPAAPRPVGAGPGGAAKPAATPATNPSIDAAFEQELAALEDASHDADAALDNAVDNAVDQDAEYGADAPPAGDTAATTAASAAEATSPAPVAKVPVANAPVANTPVANTPAAAPATPAAAAQRPSHHDEDLSELWTPDAEHEGNTLDELLVSRGIATAEQVVGAQRIQKQAPGRHYVEILREQGIDERAAQSVIAELARMPFVVIDAKAQDAFDRGLFQKLGADFCRNNQVLPLRAEGSRPIVATANADDVFLVDEIKRRLGVMGIRNVLAAPGDILGAIQSVHEAAAHAKSDEVDIDSILAGVQDEEEIELEKEDVNERDIEAEAESSPVVKYVNHIIQVALKEGASDIHIEPDEKVLKVRYRIDGILFELLTPPRKLHAALTSRIKIMANLDIAERRLPQDGRIRATVLGRKLDLRVSTVPTPKGEKTVMRILDSRSISVGLNDLGFSEDSLTIWKKQIEQPHGIILVTGPTGSGKTTTLYSSIRQMDTRKMNISTVEDPIEYNLNGITQIQTHEKIGMTFAKALKALLRQDPDVVMLGEIRDHETASTAIQAALTGHLVLSTLHTNDAPSSITRMINIGVEPFLVGAALNSVLAQRLVRKVCTKCVAERPVDDDMRDFLITHGIDSPTVRVGVGCPSCRQTGYSGRLGLYELLVLDDFLRDKIASNPNVVEFRRLCVERGMVSLREDGFAKVRLGKTTVEEVLSATEATI
jgi:type IV pilus assembly protein PilB